MPLKEWSSILVHLIFYPLTELLGPKQLTQLEKIQVFFFKKYL